MPGEDALPSSSKGKKEAHIPLFEQALIPEISRRAAKGQEVACPECRRRTVGFGETWPPWCVCGWNLGAARTALWEQRVWLFIGGLVVFGVGGLMGLAVADLMVEGDLSDWWLLTIPVVTLGGSYLVVRWRTGWQARALSQAPAVPGEGRRFAAAVFLALLAIALFVVVQLRRNWVK